MHRIQDLAFVGLPSHFSSRHPAKRSHQYVVLHCPSLSPFPIPPSLQPGHTHIHTQKRLETAGSRQRCAESDSSLFCALSTSRLISSVIVAACPFLHYCLHSPHMRHGSERACMSRLLPSSLSPLVLPATERSCLPLGARGARARTRKEIRGQHDEREERKKKVTSRECLSDNAN